MTTSTKTKAKKVTTPKEDQEVKETVSTKKLLNFKLTMTVEELVHLRDLFNILLPPTAEMTISQALATSQSRPITESKLWTKVAALCAEAALPMEDEAPDFVVAIAGPPTLGVFALQHPAENNDE